MDWFFSLIDKIIEARIWHVLFSHFHVVDWFTAALLIIGVIYGLKQGFLRMVFLTLETVLVVWLVFSFEKKFSGLLQTNLSFIKAATARPVSFMALGITFWMLVMYLDGRAKTLFHTKLTGPIKYVGGFIMGGVFMLLIWSMIAQVLMLLPFQKIHRPFNEGGSRTGAQVYSIAPTVYKAISKPASLFEAKKK